MLTLSTDLATEALGRRIAMRLEIVTGIKPNAEQRKALLFIASTVPDDAKIVDLLAASEIDNAVAAGIMTDTLKHFVPLGAALRATVQKYAQVPLFEAFANDQDVLKRRLEGNPDHMQKRCPMCSEYVYWRASSWRNLKDRPLRCSARHVFCFSSGTFVRRGG